MKHGELFALESALVYLKKLTDQPDSETTTETKAKIVKNLNIVNDKLKEVREKSVFEHPDAEKFEQERFALCEKFADRNEDGTIKKDKVKDIFNNTIKESFSITANEHLFEKEYEKLKKKYRAYWNAYEEHLQKYNNYLDSDIKLKLSKMSIKDLPKNGISTDMINILMPILKNV